eukprot:CAMPEP_0184653916 /NCGR_PEP_ID=MMETSP0308-20130426/11620_1 /TAXON_ID=38269 /ORGANISM="Gloeochaete witrockiana, Strain SAG 46.84" /LENGTH=70 /DNA_ID=CAMNT_0027089621 /DNA_START=310 /DNA_END=522 /DNA_ORIENTATION=+
MSRSCPLALTVNPTGEGRGAGAWTRTTTEAGGLGLAREVFGAIRGSRDDSENSEVTLDCHAFLDPSRHAK